MPNYAERIDSLRKEKSWSLDELGRQMNVTAVSVHRWVHGKSQPDIEALLRMADLFGVSVDYLIGRTDDRTPTPTPFPQALDGEYADLIAALKSLSPEQGEAVINMMKSMIALSKK